MWFFRAPSIVFGEEALSFLNNIDFRRIAIITDENIKRAGLVSLVLKELPENSENIVVSDIPEEPTLADIKQRATAVGEFAPDLIIGLGGGSSMDAAKAIFTLYERPDIDIYDITPLVKLNLRNKARLILIPTTSGTGSECTWAAVLSDEDHSRKNELASTEIIADHAILDPALVLKLPPGITRNTAVDAITHAVEARSSQWRNYYSDIFAEKAIELITTNLPLVLKDPDNRKAREEVHIGASMAGIAFSNAQVGLAHAMGHSLGAHFRIPHGITVALYLPQVVEFSEPEAKESYNSLMMKMPHEFRRGNLADSLRAFFKSVGQPLNVKDCGIDRQSYMEKMDTLVALAEESTGGVTNPREASSAELREMFEKVI
ncbi:MAG: iron-containing alcohol dehydrogenase [Candidatus Thermoplasmatota archaeon]|nr:iron-containing alcohol dehydrogenase [Candidatus Thermoplasmatota archaeon]MCL5954603.1 iron-containing alcohol dehydrogenase [Candidatus Thermoplasmatota archaeon]